VFFWPVTQRVEAIFTDVSGQFIDPIFKSQESSPFLTSLRNYHYSLRNNPEERCSHLLGGGSLKSRISNSAEKILSLNKPSQE
jgi:hypothetical protein